MAAEGSSVRALALLVPVVVSLAGVGLVIGKATGSAGWAVAAVAATGVGVAGLLWYLRAGATAQVRAAKETGRIDVDAFLDTASLPGTWPVDARRTMGLARDNAPAMPVRLTVDDTSLHLRKTKYGSHPFTAEIALRDVVRVTAGDASVMPIGATLRLALRDGTEVRLHFHVSRGEAVELAALLASRAPASSGAEPAAGIVITSPPP